MILRRVKLGGGNPPFMIHEIKISAIACGLIEFSQYGWRHEERIAPPPERFLGIIGQLHHRIHTLANGRKHCRIVVFEIKLQISLPYSVVISGLYARAWLPCKVLRHR